MMAYIVLGAILYMQLENWSLEDSIYFCFITLTTIGLGDLVPGQKYVFFHNCSQTENIYHLVTLS